MSDRPVTLAPSDIGAVGQPPCLTPIEIIEAGSEWLVREYRIQQQEATVFETHESRLDAMRAADDKLHADGHPCLLRWDDDDIVGDLYWNELFECLCVKYSRLLDSWVVVPEDDYYVFQADTDYKQVCEAAQAVQRQYDFKKLVLCDQAGDRQKTIEHRFLRHEIAKSGVRFNRRKPMGATATADSSRQTPATNDPEGGLRAAPTSTLMDAIPDLSSLEEIDTSGAVYRYRAVWADENPARIALLNPDYVSERPAVTCFTEIIDDWQALCEDSRVTTVFEVGPSPSVWIAYHAGKGESTAFAEEFSIESRLQIIADVAGAVDFARRHGVQRTAITPSAVRIREAAETARASLAGWGLSRGVGMALGDMDVSPYISPEELQGEITLTTPVYQLGALAYRLLCHMDPFSDTEDTEQAIRAQSLTSPSTLVDVPSAVDTVLRRALAPTPEQRYERATTFSDKLTSIFQ